MLGKPNASKIYSKLSVMFLAFNYYYGVYRNFVALTYKAVQCFQKYPMIYINLVFSFPLLLKHSQCRRSNLSENDDELWLGMWKILIYRGLSKKPACWLFSVAYILNGNDAQEQHVAATASWQLVRRLGVYWSIHFTWVTLNHLNHRQKKEYCKIQTDRYNACLFSVSEVVHWMVLGQVLAWLYLITISEVKADFTNWCLRGCLPFSIKVNVWVSKLH